METSVYELNKGINQPIQFKGLKAQYIWWLAGGCIGLFFLFTILYFIGVNTYVCLLLIVICGGLLISYIYRLSNKYGQFGMMKKIAKTSVPKLIVCRSRNVFFN